MNQSSKIYFQVLFLTLLIIMIFSNNFILANHSVKADTVVFGPIVGFNYGGSLEDEAFDIITTQDGGYAIVGRMNDYDMGIVKTDENGTEEWKTTNPLVGEQWANSIVEVPKEGFLFGGYGGWLSKVDENGNVLWRKHYNDVALIENIIELPNSTFIIGGYTDYFPHYFWLGKVDSSGDLLWQKIYNQTMIQYCYSFKESNDGGYIFLGINNTINLIFFKVDDVGGEEWELVIDDIFEDTSAVILIKEDTYGWVIAGQAKYPDESFMLAKYNFNGTKIWDQSYNNNNKEFGTAIATLDGGYLMTGTIWYTGNFDKIWTIKTDKNGLHLWNRTYTGDENQKINGIIETDVGYGLVGAITLGDNYNIYFILTDRDGIPLYVLSEEVTSTIPGLGLLPFLLVFIILKKRNSK